MSPSKPDSNTDEKLTDLILQIKEPYTRLELYCIVEFFDYLSKDNQECIDQKEYLAAINSAKKLVESMTDFISSQKFNNELLNLNFFQKLEQLVKRFSKEPLIIRDLLNFHENMMNKFKKLPNNTQNYLLAIACLNILADKKDFGKEEDAWKNYQKFIDTIKKIPKIRSIWDLY